MSYRWLIKYLADEFKDKIQQEISMAARRASTETVERKTIPNQMCVECGHIAFFPVEVDGKIYCSDCAGKIMQPLVAVAVRSSVDPSSATLSKFAP